MSYEEFTPEQSKEQHQQGMMEDLNAGYERYKKNHPDFKREVDEMERKRKEWPQTTKKVIPKPVVKYRQATVKMCGEVHKLRYKLTLLATITGPEARALIESEETGEGHVFSYDTEKKDKVEIYHEETLPGDKK
jgi:hypothetical protein